MGGSPPALHPHTAPSNLPLPNAAGQSPNKDVSYCATLAVASYALDTTHDAGTRGISALRSSGCARPLLRALLSVLEEALVLHARAVADAAERQAAAAAAAAAANGAAAAGRAKAGEGSGRGLGASGRWGAPGTPSGAAARPAPGSFRLALPAAPSGSFRAVAPEGQATEAAAEAGGSSPIPSLGGGSRGAAPHGGAGQGGVSEPGFTIGRGQHPLLSYAEAAAVALWAAVMALVQKDEPPYTYTPGAPNPSPSPTAAAGPAPEPSWGTGTVGGPGTPTGTSTAAHLSAEGASGSGGGSGGRGLSGGRSGTGGGNSGGSSGGPGGNSDGGGGGGAGGGGEMLSLEEVLRIAQMARLLAVHLAEALDQPPPASAGHLNSKSDKPLYLISTLDAPGQTAESVDGESQSAAASSSRQAGAVDEVGSQACTLYCMLSCLVAVQSGPRLLGEAHARLTALLAEVARLEQVAGEGLVVGERKGAKRGDCSWAWSGFGCCRRMQGCCQN